MYDYKRGHVSEIAINNISKTFYLRTFILIIVHYLHSQTSLQTRTVHTMIGGYWWWILTTLKKQKAIQQGEKKWNLECKICSIILPEKQYDNNTNTCCFFRTANIWSDFTISLCSTFRTCGSLSSGGRHYNNKMPLYWSNELKVVFHSVFVVFIS